MGDAREKKTIRRKYSVLLPLLPLLFLVSVWIAFSKPYLLDGLVPLQTRQLVAFFPPWNADPQYAGPIKNNAMPDVFTQIYPWKYYSIQQVKEGHAPWWNPNSFSGNPHIANYQTALFSPFTLLYFILPFVDAWSITVLLQPFIAGIGMYLYLKKLGISPIATILGSISFMFSGFLVVWMAYGTLAMSIAFLPWALYSIEIFKTNKSIGGVVLFIVSLVLSFLSGHFQTSLYLFLFVVSYLLYVVIREKKLKTFLPLFSGVIISLILSAIQIFPTIIFYLESFRSQSIVTDQGIPFSYFATLFAPDIFGNPVTGNDWVGFYAERAGFIGMIPFTLVWFSYFVRRNKTVLFFLLATVVTFLLALDSPIQSLLRMSHIPIIATSNPTRIIVLLSFSLAVLSAFGFDRVTEFLQSKEWKKLLLGLIPTMSICIVSLLLFVFLPIIPEDKASTALRNLLLPIALFLMTIGAGFLTYLRPQKLFLLTLGILLLLLTSADSLRFATKWMPFDSRELLYPKSSLLNAIQTLQEDGRVFGSIGEGNQTYYNIRGIEGYDPLYIQRYGEFIKAAETGRYNIPDRSFVVLERKSSHVERVLDLLSVKVFVQPKSHINQSWAYPVWEKGDRFVKVYDDEYYQLFENNRAMSKFTLMTNFEVITDKRERLKRFYQEDFSFRDTLLLEKEPQHITKNASVSGSITVVSSNPNEIILDVISNTQSLLFSNEPFYSQWKAEVNEKESEVFIADHAFRAVEVPEGKSRVRFYYKGLFSF